MNNQLSLLLEKYKKWLVSKDNPDYTLTEKYKGYSNYLKRLVKYMYDNKFIEENDLCSMNIDWYKHIIDVYDKNIEIKEYDKSLGNKGGIASLKKYILFIEFLNNDKKEISNYNDINETTLSLKLLNTIDKYGKNLGIHLFGIRYGKVIKEKDISVKDIIKNANIQESFITEVHKGINLSEYVTLNEEIFCANKNESISFEITGKGKNLVVFGTPGCGKSYYVNNTLLKDYPVMPNNTKERVFRTTFYQDYTNTDFIGQILPYIEYNERKEEKVTYKFTPGPFALALKEAVLNRDKEVALVIEELNRGNAPAIFGDIFQLLDRNEDGISEYAITNIHLSDWLNNEIEGANFDKIKIPGNLNIFATMNTSDQNVFTLDTAFKRRWEFKKLKNEFNGHPYESYFVPGLEETTWKTFVEVINKAIVGEQGERNSSINVSDKQIGVYFVDKDGLHKEQIDVSSLPNDGKIDKFAYKVFSYLWDDVAKFDKDQLFRKGIITLDQLIENYIKHEFVFKDEIHEKLKQKASESSENK